MKSGQWESEWALCPFYRKESGLGIYCESLFGGTAHDLHSFDTPEIKTRHTTRLCNDDYIHCPYAQALYKRYEEEDL